MKLRFFPLAVLAGICCVVGCQDSGSSKSPQNEALLKKAFEKKGFDINKVPANERAMVQGFIDHNNKLKAQEKKPGSGQ